MQDFPRISVVTPSYNQAQFIRQTIDSVLSQNYPNLDYWVIDGGSTDDSVEILKSYGKQIQWVSEKDNGQTEAINKGMNKATGEIVCYLNSDDCLMPGSLQTVAEHFMTHEDLIWLTGDCEIIDADGKIIQSFVRQYKRWWRNFNSPLVLEVLNPIAQPCTFWRQSAGHSAGVFDDSLNYCMDYDYWFRLYHLGAPEILTKTLAQFRVHGESKGGASFQSQFEEEIEVAKRYSKSKILQWLHRLHAWATVQAYLIMKA